MWFTEALVVIFMQQLCKSGIYVQSKFSLHNEKDNICRKLMASSHSSFSIHFHFPAPLGKMAEKFESQRINILE